MLSFARVRVLCITVMYLCACNAVPWESCCRCVRAQDERKMERAVVHANQLPDVAHYAIAYKSCSYKDANFVPTCVLNTMMGGGSSFSAGGPGKGLHSRLYMNVLSQHYFVMNAIATNHPYADTGLFVFSGSCAPSNVSHAHMCCVSTVLYLLLLQQQYLETCLLQSPCVH